jgi:hypothetical protein
MLSSSAAFPPGADEHKCATDHSRRLRARLIAPISSEAGVDGMLLLERTGTLLSDMDVWGEVAAAWLIAAACLACLGFA